MKNKITINSKTRKEITLEVRGKDYIFELNLANTIAYEDALECLKGITLRNKKIEELDAEDTIDNAIRGEKKFQLFTEISKLAQKIASANLKPVGHEGWESLKEDIDFYGWTEIAKWVVDSYADYMIRGQKSV